MKKSFRSQLRILLLPFMLLCVCLLLVLCKPHSGKFIINTVREYRIKIPGDIHENINLILSSQKLVVFGDSVFLYFFDPLKNKILYTEINSGKGFRSVSPELPGDFISEAFKTDLLWIEPDLLALFSETSQKTALINLKGKLLKLISLKRDKSPFSQKPGPENSYSCQSYLNSTFEYSKGRLYFQLAYTDIFLHDLRSFREYFSRNSQLSVSTSDTLSKPLLFLHFPSSYRQGNYLGEFNSFRTCAGSRIVFSFPYSDSVYRYSGDTLLSKTLLQSRYHPVFKPFDRGKTMDFSYQLKFRIENPYYEELVYDRFHDRYFRVFKKPMSYLNEQGRIRNETEIGWSLIIAGNDLKTLGEADFPPEKYSGYRIVPARNGLYIMHPVDSCTRNHTIEYSLITLSEP